MQLRRATGNQILDEPIRRGVRFARHFLHPDGSFAGEYGSRGTSHFYPHGMELLAAVSAEAADLADGFLNALARATHAYFSDDRLFAHRLGNRIEAYLDWSPVRARPPGAEQPIFVHFANAGLVVSRHGDRQTVVSTARNGIFKHFAPRMPCLTDAGLVVETDDGAVAVSQSHDRRRAAQVALEDGGQVRITVSGMLDAAPAETATPLKQSLLHVGMWLVGRWFRTTVRQLLQQRVITGRRPLPIRFARTIEILEGSPSLRVTDTIELASPAITIRRMAFGTDHQAAYVAACGVYHDSVLQPWTELADQVEALNRDRRVVVVREF